MSWKLQTIFRFNPNPLSRPVLAFLLTSGPYQLKQRLSIRAQRISSTYFKRVSASFCDNFSKVT